MEKCSYMYWDYLILWNWFESFYFFWVAPSITIENQNKHSFSLDFYAVYTDVYTFLPWINSVINVRLFHFLKKLFFG